MRTSRGMTPFDTLSYALRALRDNRMRSALTILGIVIGVSAVVTAVSVGQGAATNITNSIKQMGDNLLTIIPVNMSSGPGGPPGLGGSSTTLTPKDAEAVHERCADSIVDISQQISKSVALKARTETHRTNLTGATPAFFSVNNWKLAKGRVLTENDEKARSRVIVIGPTVVESLFGSKDANCIGETILVNRTRFKVVGILQSKGAGALGMDQDDVVVAPLSTAMNRVVNQDYLSMVNIQCKSADSIDLVKEQIESLLRNRHNLQPPFPDNDDFSVMTQSQQLNTIQTVGTILTIVLAGIAAISLTVGGVGVMNIMLVSVRERTREIGIRKSLGATPANIRTQFLIEASLLSIAGGIVGVVFGAGVSLLAGRLTGWPITPSLISAIVAVAVSGAIGVFFGYWPASQAANLPPIDALRQQ